MNPETKNCQNCQTNFEITSDDLGFYTKIKVPPPTFCPECRLVRRLVMRNERTLYKRKCDLCEQDKILIYPNDSEYKVYCFDCWHSDKWDGVDYAQGYDFSKPFFEQYINLFNKTPRLGVIQQGFNKNSEYNNRVSDLKNCYLIFASNQNENCHYGVGYWFSKDSVDCYNTRKGERCFECTDCYNCNSLRYSKECNGCIDSWFLVNCRNCQNCYGCFNLRNKNYCIFNEQYTKEEYFNKLKELGIGSRREINKTRKVLEKEELKYLVPPLINHHSVDVSGNWIENSKNIKTAFNCDKTEDGKYLFGLTEAKDVMDYTYWGNTSELMYECASVGRQCSDVKFSNESWDQLIRAEYCHNCLNCSDIFGCVGLRKKQYCILNKQYTKEEYQELIPRIKKHMVDMPFIDNVGRIIKYGEFFPCDMAPSAYNETIAQEYFPKNKEQALLEGYRWKEPDDKIYTPTLFAGDLPDIISEVEDNITKEIIACAHDGKCNEQCTTAFRITLDELQLYRILGVPVPTLCPNCRYYERLSKRQPIKLLHRICMKEGCNNEFETSYAPDRPEIVYCEKCYQQEVY